MGKRRHQRIKTVVPVRLFGVDGLGKPFAELAHTLDVSHSGVRLGGVAVAPEEGAVITLQCHHRKCQFTVAWVGCPGSSRNKQVGLISLEPERDIFGLRLKDETIVDDFVPSEDGMDAGAPGGVRRAPRFLANGSANIRRVNSMEERLAEIQDVGATGCYLKTATPFKVATQVGLTLRVDDSTIQVFAKVTACHPMMGMGLEFERFYTEDDEATLQVRLKKLEGDKPPEPAPSRKPDTAAIAGRLQQATRELEDVDQLMQSGAVDPSVLNEFRDALSQVRNTAWA
ncbi:MAG: PilZ domain-containing protein, partial [Terriglobales bacterium]